MAGYRVTKLPVGTRVSWWADPRGPGHGQHAWGTVIQHIADNILVVWDDDDDYYEHWDAREVRYRIDRGQMRLHRPKKARRTRIPADQLTCKVCGRLRSEKCGCPRIGAPKPEEWGQKSITRQLTRDGGSDMMQLSNEGATARVARKGETDMAKTSKASAPEVDETPDEGGDLLSAKEAASKIGTDARTLRKFLRKENGLVGQGQRWAIDPNDIDELKKRFDAWSKGGKASPTTKKGSKAAPPDDDATVEELDADAVLSDDDLEELDDLDELEEL